MNQRESQRRATRRALAEQALRLFTEHGYEETTVEEIANAAGVSERTFFLHFSTKAAAVFPDHEERLAAFVEMLGTAAEQRDPLAHLIHVVIARMRTSTPVRIARYALLETVPTLRDEDARTDRDYERAMAEYLVGCWGSSPEASLRAHAVANAIVAVVRASLTAWARDGVDGAEACAEMLHRMFGRPFDDPLQSLHSLQSGPPARRGGTRRRTERAG